jgi:hypothetical protein
MSEAERYALGLLVEEMGESLCHIGRALRFGIDTQGQDGVTERDGLARELGDVWAAIEYAMLAKIGNRVTMPLRADRKLAKLLDPEAKDNLGRRLAPDLQP